MLLKRILKGIESFFTGTDLDYIFNIVDKKLSITDLTGIKNGFGSIDDGLYRNGTDYDLDL